MAEFRLSGIDGDPFAALFERSDAELAELGAERWFATVPHGFPCRVSLQDAEVGAELLLLGFEHQPALSPYRASGPIFVRRHAKQRMLEPGEVPPYVSSRLISLRGYDTDHMIVDATVCEGIDVAEELRQRFERADIAYIHLHNAKRGCYSCLASRVSAAPG